MTIVQLAEWAKRESAGVCESFVKPHDWHLCVTCGRSEQHHVLGEIAAALSFWPVFPPAQLSEEHAALLARVLEDVALRRQACNTAAAVCDLVMDFMRRNGEALAPLITTPLAGEMVTALVIGMTLGFGPAYQEPARRELAVDELLAAARVGGLDASREAAALALREVH